MIVAVFTTAGLLFGALAVAFALTWRRDAVKPVRVEAKVEGPTCFPRVKR